MTCDVDAFNFLRAPTRAVSASGAAINRLVAHAHSPHRLDVKERRAISKRQYVAMTDRREGLGKKATAETVEPAFRCL